MAAKFYVDADDLGDLPQARGLVDVPVFQMQREPGVDGLKIRKVLCDDVLCLREVDVPGGKRARTSGMFRPAAQGSGNLSEQVAGPGGTARCGRARWALASKPGWTTPPFSPIIISLAPSSLAAARTKQITLPVERITGIGSLPYALDGLEVDVPADVGQGAVDVDHDSFDFREVGAHDDKKKASGKCK